MNNNFKQMSHAKTAYSCNRNANCSIKTTKRPRSIFIWSICASLYILIILTDSYLVFKNEMDRSGRDRLSATIDLIQYYSFEIKFDEMIEFIRTIIKNQSKTRAGVHSEIIKYSRGLNSNFEFKQTQYGLFIHFQNGYKIKYFDHDNTIKTLKNSSSNENKYFSFFPEIKSLHYRYKETDYDEKSELLQQMHKRFDFSDINDNYLRHYQSRHFRFTVFIILMIFFPTIISFLFVKYFTDKN